MSERSNSGNGIGCGTVLFFIFLTLKLTGNIDWSWWWVFAPLWIPVVAAVLIMGVVVIVHLLKGDEA